MFVTVLPKLLESVRSVPDVVAKSNNFVLATGVMGKVGGVKAPVYSAVPVTQWKLVIYPGKGEPGFVSFPIANTELVLLKSYVFAVVVSFTTPF